MNVHDSVHEEVLEGTYGPWVVVACRKKGTKSQRSGRVSFVQGNEQAQSRNELRAIIAPGQSDSSSGPNRESKRKLSPPRIINGLK